MVEKHLWSLSLNNFFFFNLKKKLWWLSSALTIFLRHFLVLCSSLVNIISWPKSNSFQTWFGSIFISDNCATWRTSDSWNILGMERKIWGWTSPGKSQVSRVNLPCCSLISFSTKSIKSVGILWPPLGCAWCLLQLLLHLVQRQWTLVHLQCCYTNISHRVTLWWRFVLGAGWGHRARWIGGPRYNFPNNIPVIA